jgi:hypothetical protein
MTPLHEELLDDVRGLDAGGGREVLDGERLGDDDLAAGRSGRGRLTALGPARSCWRRCLRKPPDRCRRASRSAMSASDQVPGSPAGSASRLRSLVRRRALLARRPPLVLRPAMDCGHIAAHPGRPSDGHAKPRRPPHARPGRRPVHAGRNPPDDGARLGRGRFDRGRALQRGQSSVRTAASSAPWPEAAAPPERDHLRAHGHIHHAADAGPRICGRGRPSGSGRARPAGPGPWALHRVDRGSSCRRRAVRALRWAHERAVVKAGACGSATRASRLAGGGRGMCLLNHGCRCSRRRLGRSITRRRGKRTGPAHGGSASTGTATCSRSRAPPRPQATADSWSRPPG